MLVGATTRCAQLGLACVQAANTKEQQTYKQRQNNKQQTQIIIARRNKTKKHIQTKRIQKK
jgi:hypothetical protein